MTSPLPTDVEEFVVKYIDSLEELEILLLVSASPGREWNGQTVYAELKTSPSSVERRLQELADKRLLRSTGEGGYQFQPAHPTFVETVGHLASAYKERRLSVLECLFTKPLSALRIFSDAFKIHRDQGNG